MKNSLIAWTHHTFNPWIGCTKVAPECDHCYAAHLMDTRLHRVRWGAGNPRARTRPATWQAVRRWNQDAADRGVRERVFCASLADVFDGEKASPLDAWRADLFALIDECRALDWLLLTKRIRNAARMLPWRSQAGAWPHVWIGASVGTQKAADNDVDALLATPAALRFLSMEPILERVDLRFTRDVMEGAPRFVTQRATLIDWVIVGGESGPHARRTALHWIVSVVDQCKAAGVPVFVKQIGARPFIDDGSEDGIPVAISDDKGGNSSDWPAEIRIREVPR